MEYTVDEMEAVSTNLLMDECSDAIHGMILQTNKDAHYSIYLNPTLLLARDVRLCRMWSKEPKGTLEMLDRALLKAQKLTIQLTTLSQGQVSVKLNCHVRLPLGTHTTQRHLVPRTKDIGQMIHFKGTVIRTGMLKMVQTCREYYCPTCKSYFKVLYDRDNYCVIPKPTKCLIKINCKGKVSERDPGEPLMMHCKDYQEIKVQEQMAGLEIGNIPRSITVILEDDLVDVCKPGDDVYAAGIVIRRWKSGNAGQRCNIELSIIANNLQVNNQQDQSSSVNAATRHDCHSFWRNGRLNPFKARDVIVSSFCPDLVGMYWVKLAVLLVLVGGVTKFKDGLKIRGDAHLLLVGDPGIGKSQFLKFAAKVSPRTVYTTGIGSTNAGLTVTAVKDSGEWQLEAGALVLADRGLCCIDEFGSIREQDKTAIHEAMEQQTISVAKAGLVCKLNTRCSIIAATNPKGKYDESQDIEVNIALASPLLSRFDIILILLDSQNEAWDQTVSSHILNEEVHAKARNSSSSSTWDIPRLSSYISFIKADCSPSLTDDANEVLKRYYQIQRSSDIRNAARTTIRMLESLVRLAQAHARLMYQKHVLVKDAVTAVLLMEMSMRSSAINGVFSALHESFPSDPDAYYLEKERDILTRLGLESLAGSDVPHDCGMEDAEEEFDELGDGEFDDDLLDQLLEPSRPPVNIHPQPPPPVHVSSQPRPPDHVPLQPRPPAHPLLQPRPPVHVPQVPIQSTPAVSVDLSQFMMPSGTGVSGPLLNMTSESIEPIQENPRPTLGHEMSDDFQDDFMDLVQDLENLDQSFQKPDSPLFKRPLLQTAQMSQKPPSSNVSIRSDDVLLDLFGYDSSQMDPENEPWDQPNLPAPSQFRKTFR